MLKAEMDSRYQFGGPKHNKSVPDYAKVWEITVRKGGLSILNDAYLISGRITDNEASFATHFGVMTQWLNDIKDVVRDCLTNRMKTMKQGSIRHSTLSHLAVKSWTAFMTTS